MLDGPEGLAAAKATFTQATNYLRCGQIRWPDGTVRKLTPQDRRTARSNLRQLAAYIEEHDEN